MKRCCNATLNMFVLNIYLYDRFFVFNQNFIILHVRIPDFLVKFVKNILIFKFSQTKGFFHPK